MPGKKTLLLVCILITGFCVICSAATESPSDIDPDVPMAGETGMIGGDTGWIFIDSVPQGAFVELDGVGEGTTPVQIEVSSTGTPSHSLKVSLSGYQDWTGHISGNPAPGETIYQTANLVKIEPTITVEPTQIGGDFGWFKIDSYPSGADVTFDSVYQGTTPVLVKVPVTGTPSHDLLVRMNGYQDYLQRLTYNPGRDQTAPVSVSLIPLSPYGSISVTSDPSGALATLDSGQQYLTPCTFTQVITGTHTVSVSKAGYSPYSTQVRVDYNTVSRVNAPLRKMDQTGVLYADSLPQGADVKVDNLWQGQTPQRVENLAGGTHTVRFQLSGYQSVSQDVVISPGQETRVRPSLVRNPPQVPTGSILVSSTPSGTSVFLNDEYQGLTPDSGGLDLTDLTPGIYTVLLNRSGFVDYSAPVTVTAGQVTPVTVTLKEIAVPGVINGTLRVSSTPSGAHVLLNNHDIGATPLMYPILPGVYDLVLKMDGYTDYISRVQIASGMSTNASASLVPVSEQPSASVSPTSTPGPAGTSAPLSLFPLIAGMGAALVLRLYRRDE